MVVLRRPDHQAIRFKDSLAEPADCFRRLVAVAIQIFVVQGNIMKTVHNQTGIHRQQLFGNRPKNHVVDRIGPQAS
ncbi:hypothetical protein D3C84_1021080 [compost metagenome]